MDKTKWIVSEYIRLMELYLAGASSSLYFTSKIFSGGFFLWVILPPSSSRTHKQLQRQWKIKWKSRHSQTSGRMEGQKEKRNRRVSSPLSLSIRTFLMFWVVWALRTDGGQYSVLAKPSGQRLFCVDKWRTVLFLRYFWQGHSRLISICA